MVFLKKNYIDPTGRQNFGDAPGQIPKLILTLCLRMSNGRPRALHPGKNLVVTFMNMSKSARKAKISDYFL